MAIEIVDFPIKNGGSFHSYVAVYQRVHSELEHQHVHPSSSIEVIKIQRCLIHSAP
jgi:hypothetical protein